MSILSREFPEAKQVINQVSRNRNEPQALDELNNYENLTVLNDAQRLSTRLMLRESLMTMRDCSFGIASFALLFGINIVASIAEHPLQESLAFQIPDKGILLGIVVIELLGFRHLYRQIRYSFISDKIRKTTMILNSNRTSN